VKIFTSVNVRIMSSNLSTQIRTWRMEILGHLHQTSETCMGFVAFADLPNRQLSGQLHMNSRRYPNNISQDYRTYAMRMWSEFHRHPFLPQRGNSFSNFRMQFILNIHTVRELRASRGKESDRYPKVRKLEGRIPAVRPMRPATLVHPSRLHFPL
jgi:hypothetical protein